jgi:hypothetical protein
MPCYFDWAQVQTSAFFDSVEGRAEAFSSRERAVNCHITPVVSTSARKWVLVPVIDRPQPANKFVFRVIA